MKKTNVLAATFLATSFLGTTAYAADKNISTSTVEQTIMSPLKSIQSKLTTEEVEMTSYDKLISVLKRHNAQYRLVDHASEGQSERVSELRGSTLEQSAKMMVFMSKLNKKDRAYTLTVIPANQQVDFAKVALLEKAPSTKDVLRAPEDRAKLLTGCIPGAILPFSFKDELRIVVDPSLAHNSSITEIAFNVTLGQSMFLNLEDYLEITQPLIQQITK